MNCKLAKLAITATIALVITFTFNACEEKKKQDGTDTTATEPAAEAATQEAATQEAVAEKPAENAGGGFKTVKIGTQTWMAENLNIEIEGSKCYGNDPANCQKYGSLYMGHGVKELCPAGWKLPSREDWNKLVTAAGGKKTAGKKLKSKSGWDNRDDGSSGNGTDDYGFSALPSGILSYEPDVEGGIFQGLGFQSLWWTATEDEDGKLYRIGIYSADDEVGEFRGDSNSDKFSVRCIKD
jgi:uncharacterized protein (TIGR02145 family)